MTTYSSNIRNGTGTIKLEIRQDSQSIADNTSTIYYNLYIQGKSGYGFWNEFNSGQTSVYINGNRVHYQTGRNFNIQGGGTQQLASGTTTVKHNEDGSKSFTFSASLWSSSATGSISGNFNLSKIHRKSDFSVKDASGKTISSFYAGDKIAIEIDKKVSSFNHTLSIKYLDQEETLISKTTATSLAYTTSNKIMENYMQNLRSMPIEFVVNTYDGNTSIGYEVKRLTINVPSSAGPVIDSIDVKEANNNKINIIGETPFYQLLSNLNIITKASAKYGASIKSISVSLGNLTKTGSNVVLENVNLKGNQNIKVTVNDTRGLSTSTTKTISLSPYDMPNIAFFNSYRTETNTKYANGRLAITSTVIDTKNPLYVKVDVADKGSSSWRNVYSATVGNGKLNDTISLGGGFDDFKAYDVRLTIADKFKRHQAISNIPATSQSLVIGATKPIVGIGKVPNIDKGLDIKDFAQIEGNNQKKLSFKGTRDSGSLIEWNTDGTQTNRICSWGGKLSFGGSDVSFREGIQVSNDLYLGGDIKPSDSEKSKEYNVILNDMTGYIKCTKDPLSNVHIWGKVKISGTYPTGRWKVWGKIPKNWAPRVTVPLPSTNDSRTIDGIAITADGDITWIAQLNNSYSPSVGDSFVLDYIYRAGDGDW